ncbi:DUF1559 domain-containing protein [Bremerella cremea]|uniref:DUF1559 family PulG-like putative transporter n=1 Tax=Bremerella cremea TaxID=1031537 RepID=UPI0031F08632
MACVLLTSLLGCGTSSPDRQALENIAHAFNNYRDTFGAWPPIQVEQADGQPLHSWRVLILPFVEANAFYDEYDFTSAWNAPSNADLADGTRHQPGAKFPQPAGVGTFYQTGNRSHANDTRFVAYVEHAMQRSPFSGVKTEVACHLPPQKSILILELTDSGIHWMEPKDVVADSEFQSGGLTLEEVAKRIVGSVEIGATTIIRDRSQTLHRLDWPTTSEP